MIDAINKGVKNTYNKTINSIAFLPGIIAICFLGLSFLMISFDFSETGKQLKSSLSWLSLKDASTARSICSSIAAGTISLTVFSFSMVMILLSQAASQMSNRILGKLIGNRFQQIVLGFYIGTIVYALFLLSTIRDINSGIYVPAISTYLLIALTVVDIFLFIYFLHYITQSVKFETIIHRILEDTQSALQRTCTSPLAIANAPIPPEGMLLTAPKSGSFQGFIRDRLIEICKKEQAVIYFHYPLGTYVIENTPFMTIQARKNIDGSLEEKLKVIIDIGKGQEIQSSYDYGFRQLMEIAIKALSPGINDPGRAAISLQAIGTLLAYRMRHFPLTQHPDEDGIVRIYQKQKDLETEINEYLLPIWDYGKDDRMIRREMLHILSSLEKLHEEPSLKKLLQEVKQSMMYEHN